VRKFSELSTEAFRAFWAAKETLNFTEAASIASMTQSGVSQHIARLESQLEAELFLRINKKVVLTEAGRRLTSFIEKYLEEPRHIEVQVLGDTHGNIVHLFERECSMQRNNQKVLEEAPSPFLDEKTRQVICAAGVAAARAVDYVGAGTVEFLMNPDKSFYFIEMNTRIQVEHPVTEWITGVDLIEWQIRVAWGQKLDFTQQMIKKKGHAIECRINAEHPFKFTPSPGTVELYHAPGGRSVRVDSHLYTGYCIPPYYDSMIGKVITHAREREKCIRRMQRAMDELVILGVTTNQELHQRLLANPGFQSGNFNIHFLERWLNQMHL